MHCCVIPFAIYALMGFQFQWVFIFVFPIAGEFLVEAKCDQKTDCHLLATKRNRDWNNNSCQWF